MAGFKIAAAQVPSIRGSVVRNVATHATVIRAAADRGVTVLIFPELSLTGYEPDRAAPLALTPADERLEPLRALAQRTRMHVVVGAPLANPESRPWLGSIVFGADGAPWTYHKMYLGGTEPTYFTAGTVPGKLTAAGHTVGLAICADSSRPSHPRQYADTGADIYAASVFLNAEWFATDVPRLAGHAREFGLMVVMANQAASAGTYVAVGQSAIWAPTGELLAVAPVTDAAIVVGQRQGASWLATVMPIPASAANPID